MNWLPRRVSRRTVLRWGAAGLVALGGIEAFASRLEVTRRTLRLPGWGADGFRVAQVSDVHLNNDGLLATAREAVRHAVTAKPDLFVFTGDFLNFDDDRCLDRIGRAFEELEELACPCLAVLGNHDYMSGAARKVAAAVSATRMKLLVNEAVDVGGVRVVGFDDAILGTPDLTLLQTGETASTIALVHEPDFVDRIPPDKGLVLSGHSHGGEVCLPGGRPLYTPLGARVYRSGFYPDAPTPVYVNRGTATLAPIRLFCPPEVAILTLTGA